MMIATLMMAMKKIVMLTMATKQQQGKKKTMWGKKVKGLRGEKEQRRRFKP